MKEKILELYEIINPIDRNEKLLIPQMERLNSEIEQIVILSERSSETLKKLSEKIRMERRNYIGKGILEFSIISSTGYLVYPVLSSSIFYFPLKNSIEGMINYYLTRAPLADLMYYASISGKNLIQFYSYMPPLLYQLWEVFAFVFPIAVFLGIAFHRFYNRWKVSQQLKKLEKILGNQATFRKDKRIKLLNNMIRKGKSLNEVAWKAETMGLKTVAEFIRYVEYWLARGERKKLDVKFLREKYEV